MNKIRKSKITNIIAKLNNCSNDLEDIFYDEQSIRENIPENLQGGSTYCTSEDCSDRIEDAISDIQSAVSSLEEI